MQLISLEENGNYDLILLDIMLPEINGYELLEYIKPTEIPVIFLTAKGTVNDRIKGGKVHICTVDLMCGNQYNLQWIKSKRFNEQNINLALF